MPNYIEPKFLGLECKGPNPDRAKEVRREAELLAKFYELPKSAQLIIAAATTEMEKQNES